MNKPRRENPSVLLNSPIENVLAVGAPSTRPGVVRGLVVDILDTGEIDVVVPPDADTRIRCDYLESAANAALELGISDRVLVMLPAGEGQHGCVLGRIGRYQPPKKQPAQEQVVIEAGGQLTLKCGASTIDLRKDGKLLIRGNDVVSKAKRTHKIKGGTVAIN